MKHHNQTSTVEFDDVPFTVLYHYYPARPEVISNPHWGYDIGRPSEPAEVSIISVKIYGVDMLANIPDNICNTIEENLLENWEEPDGGF